MDLCDISGSYREKRELIYDAGRCNCSTDFVSVVDGFYCLCNPGYAGLRCEQDIDDCVNSLCSANSICKDLHLVSIYFFLLGRVMHSYNGL